MNNRVGRLTIRIPSRSPASASYIIQRTHVDSPPPAAAGDDVRNRKTFLVKRKTFLVKAAKGCF